MAEVLQVEKRDLLGSANSRRLRNSGRVPAVLYGHKQDTEHLAISQADAESIVRHHAKIVELQGAVTETALVSSLQWDPLGIEILHVDLQRVDLSEKVEVKVPIRFRGEPVGARHGGIVVENVHEVEIRCSAVTIPEYVVLTVLDVDAGENRSAGDITLPEGVELLTPVETVVYTIEIPKGAKDAGTGEEGEAGE
ncbi:50S ribosomal protein L25 [Stieleria varia]|uniref:Large ribosomal subunit protein bL25 n=1 Tax=Stieleria varia TaxID=2528005 RepID=A0A5C6AZH4_9BACT|nr:50S ribosomal protein L25 [Stieleria varia]TWU05110.1 50S ribosomal protein L25 [Stieleria varia]